jgi:hypothetical protein
MPEPWPNWCDRSAIILMSWHRHFPLDHPLAEVFFTAMEITFERDDDVSDAAESGAGFSLRLGLDRYARAGSVELAS